MLERIARGIPLASYPAFVTLRMLRWLGLSGLIVGVALLVLGVDPGGVIVTIAGAAVGAASLVGQGHQRVPGRAGWRLRVRQIIGTVFGWLRRLRSWNCFCVVQHATSVELVLLSRGHRERRVDGLECRVWDEGGNAVSCQLPDMTVPRGRGETINYPGLFHLAQRPVMRGRYRVEWRMRRRWSRTRRKKIARCDFIIPPGKPGWFVLCEPAGLPQGDSAFIRLLHETGLPDSFRKLECEITAPDGRRWKAPVDRDALGNGVPLQTHYPMSFAGAPPLVPGRYSGEFTSWQPDAPVGVGGRRALVRGFHFDWPNLSVTDQLEVQH